MEHTNGRKTARHSLTRYLTRYVSAWVTSPLLKVTSPLMIAALLSALATQTHAETAYIDVNGQGEVEVFPDFLTLSIALTATESTVALAKDQVDQSFSQLTTTAKALGIQADDIESNRVSNHPQWQYERDGKRTLTGHTVQRPVTVTLRDLDQYGALLEAIMVDEQLQVQRTALGFDNLEEHQSKARTLALLKAKAKAVEMAATLGQVITGVLWIQEQGSHFPRPMMEMAPMAMMRSAKADTGSEMQVQQQTVSQTVQVRFAMEED